MWNRLHRSSPNTITKQLRWWWWKPLSKTVKTNGQGHSWWSGSEWACEQHSLAISKLRTVYIALWIELKILLTLQVQCPSYNQLTAKAHPGHTKDNLWTRYIHRLVAPSTQRSLNKNFVLGLCTTDHTTKLIDCRCSSPLSFSNMVDQCKNPHIFWKTQKFKNFIWTLIQRTLMLITKCPQGTIAVTKRPCCQRNTNYRN